jgi:phosphoglucosamine mutase
MITASHNPYTDNGIKIVSSGFKLTQIEEEILENFIDNEPYYISDTKGIVCKIEDSNKKYLEFISKYISKYNLNIAIDAANGAASYISKLVFDKVSDKTSYIASNPNGRNVNLNCGSTNIEFLKNYVLENNCDLGFSFDGDGDRIIAVSKNGNIIDGDLIIYILAIYLKEKNMLNKNTVVTTIMSNLGVKKALNLKNISTIEVNVGDKYVYDALNKNGLSLGGEASGHIIVKDIFETGDGILISLLLLKAINELGLTLDDFYNQIELSYSRLINIKVNDKERVMNNISLFNRRSEIEKLLGDSSKVIIRPSGTENLIRLSIITFDFKNADKYILELKNIIENI